MWMTIKGYAAFSKSLCVLYMHVWYTEFCGNCPLEWDFFFPVWLSISAYWVSQNLDFWLSVPAFLFLLFQRQIFISSQFFKHLEKTRKPIKQEAKCLIWRVLRARSIYFKPFIYAARKEKTIRKLKHLCLIVYDSHD